MLGQGTAAVVLAGILAAQPLTGRSLAEHTFMLVGDGAGGTAIAEVLAEAVARRSPCAAWGSQSPIDIQGQGCEGSVGASPNGA